ncbi:MAG TPA: hypothetical protein DCG75_16445 [Bacteroidales bacterium]|jgi:hypothetical protein|nr:hypothetical protein [Bacteroidales bacterium]
MNFNSIRTSLKLILLIFYCFIASSSTYAQSNLSSNSNINSQKNYVKWLAQIPSVDNQQEHQKFKDKFFNFILGKKTSGLSKPVAVYAHGCDSVIILDQGCQTILDLNMKIGELSPRYDNKKYRFPSLIGICATTNSSFLITDSKLNKIFIINHKDKVLKEFNDSFVFQQPTGIAYSSKSKTVWVIETAAHKISVFDEKGDFIYSIGKRGTAHGEFNFPTFIWIDSLDQAYVVDAMNYRIQLFDSKGQFIKAFGKAGDATGYFARPKGIATDSFGNIYVVDALFNAVQIFDKSGNFLYQFGSQGQDKEQFWMPSGIFIDKNNYIYVADSYNSRIQIFQLVKED